MFSSNIIEREQAFQGLFYNHNTIYVLMVVGLLVISWKLSKWI